MMNPGNVTEYTTADLSIDDIVIGVRLIDANQPQRPPSASGGPGGGGQ
jgi:hypothetical protein